MIAPLAPHQGTHSVKNSSELVDGKLCRIVHPTTLSHFAPGILHSRTRAVAALTLMPARFDATYIGVYENLNIVIDVHPA
jgi:hypothetical protein